MPQNIGEKIICTNLPTKSKEIELNNVVKLSEQKALALIFGINQRNNKILKKIKEEAYGHLDITNKRIRLSLDSEIGAICHSFFNIKKG